jgi:hypothetical protein
MFCLLDLILLGIESQLGWTELLVISIKELGRLLVATRAISVPDLPRRGSLLRSLTLSYLEFFQIVLLLLKLQLPHVKSLQEVGSGITKTETFRPFQLFIIILSSAICNYRVWSTEVIILRHH